MWCKWSILWKSMDHVSVCQIHWIVHLRLDIWDASSMGLQDYSYYEYFWTFLEYVHHIYWLFPEKVKFLCVLVLSVCDNRLSQTGWHKQKFIFLEVQDQGTSSLGFCGVLLLGLHKAVLLLCSHVAFSLCMHIPDPSSSSYKDTSPIVLGLTFI